MERREFVKRVGLGVVEAAALLSVGGLPSALATALPNVKKGRLLLAISSDASSSIFRIFDWDNYESKDFKVPLANPHSITLDRTNPDVAYFFESFGSCLKYNLATGESQRINHLESDLLFSGHGVQSKSGELLLCTENDRKLGTIISIRSTKTMKRVAVAPRECKNAHQLVHLPGSTVVACGNMDNADPDKKKGAITFYDYEKDAVVNRVDVGVPVLHLVPMSSSEALGVSLIYRKTTPRESSKYFQQSSRETISGFFNDTNFFPGPICYAKTDGTSRKIWDEHDLNLFRFSFGVAPLPDHTMFLSSQLPANQVLLWKNSEIAHRFDVPTPSHLFVSKDGTEFIVRSQESVLRVFSLKTLKEISLISDPRGAILTASAY